MILALRRSADMEVRAWDRNVTRLSGKLLNNRPGSFLSRSTPQAASLTACH
jgi:hypothetical protein